MPGYPPSLQNDFQREDNAVLEFRLLAHSLWPDPVLIFAKADYLESDDAPLLHP